MRRRQLALLSMVVLLAAITLVPGRLAAAPAAQGSGCQIFSETGGFAVCDDGQGRFLSEFRRLGGVRMLGYPVSRRFERDGFVTQAFQKAILQWRPDQNRVNLVNVFDELHAAGFDKRLLETRQTPNQLPSGWDGSLTFAQVVARRQALLDARPALRRAYFAVGDPLTFYGLPTSEIIDMGNHFAIRLQRAVLQEWKEAVPWARAGEVTIANGGDIAKELGHLPAIALVADGQVSTAVLAAPTAVPTVEFRVVEDKMLHRTENGCGMNLLFLKVVDAAGNPLDGIPIQVSWPGGSYDLVTGVKGPGVAEFTMRGAYQARITGNFKSETTRWLDNEFPGPSDLIPAGYCDSEADCKEKENNNQLCRWHYSYRVTFKRSY